MYCDHHVMASVRARFIAAALALVATGIVPAAAAAQSDSVPRVVGRWDLRVQGSDGVYPSWLEVLISGDRILVGRFVV